MLTLNLTKAEADLVLSALWFAENDGAIELDSVFESAEAKVREAIVHFGDSLHV